jgi:hypothetical protein
MSIKFKALGLAVLAALAVGAVSVVSAGADSGGVIHSDVQWTHVVGAQEGPSEDNRLHDFTVNDAVTCDSVTYTGSVGGKTPTQLTVIPEYTECHTQKGFPASIQMNGCGYTLTFADMFVEHHTAHLQCPTGKTVVATVNPPIVGECHVHIPPQTPTEGGVAYTTIVENGKHAQTLNVTAEGVTVNRIDTGGGCLGHAGHDNVTSLTATAVLTAYDTNVKQVNLTVTTESE